MLQPCVRETHTHLDISDLHMRQVRLLAADLSANCAEAGEVRHAQIVTIMIAVKHTVFAPAIWHMVTTARLPFTQARAVIDLIAETIRSRHAAVVIARQTGSRGRTHRGLDNAARDRRILH